MADNLDAPGYWPDGNGGNMFAPASTPKPKTNYGQYLPLLGGLLGGVLGGGGSDHGMGQYMNTQASDAANINGLGDTHRRTGDTQMDYYGEDNANSRGAIGNYAAYLKRNPNTDQQDAAGIARATSGTADAYARARANLLGSYDYNAGPSGATAGALGNLAMGQANAYGLAQNDQAQRDIAMHRANLEGLVDLYGNQSQRDFGNANTAYGNAGNEYQTAFGDFGQLYRQAQEQAQQEAQQKQAMIGGATQLAGMFF
jgi:hypothetical protein